MARSLNQFFNDFVSEHSDEKERTWFEKQGIDYDEFKRIGEELIKEKESNDEVSTSQRMLAVNQRL